MGFMAFMQTGIICNGCQEKDRKPKNNNEKTLGSRRLPVVRWTAAQTVVYRASLQQPSERVLYVILLL